MRRSFVFTLTIAVSIFLAACANTADNSNNTAQAIPVPRSVVPPNRSELVELEKRAFEAWKNKDGKFFEGFLARRFVSTGPNGRRDRAAEIASVTGSNCTISNYSFSEEAMTVLGSDAAALTMKADIDAVCGGQKLPTPIWSATVFVREDDNWKAAYHGEVPAADAAPGPAAPAPASSPDPVDNTAPDQTMQALLAIENHNWQARQKKDQRILTAITMLDLAYIDPAGKGRHKKTEAVELWMDPNCKVNSYSLTEPKGDLLEPNIGLLTYKANVSGTCSGRPLTQIWGATVFMKEMGYWKALLILHSPA